MSMSMSDFLDSAIKELGGIHAEAASAAQTTPDPTSKLALLSVVQRVGALLQQCLVVQGATENKSQRPSQTPRAATMPVPMPAPIPNAAPVAIAAAPRAAEAPREAAAVPVPVASSPSPALPSGASGQVSPSHRDWPFDSKSRSGPLPLPMPLRALPERHPSGSLEAASSLPEDDSERWTLLLPLQEMDRLLGARHATRFWTYLTKPSGAGLLFCARLTVEETSGQQSTFCDTKGAFSKKKAQIATALEFIRAQGGRGRD